jgi:L-fuconate dehydratase
VVVEDGHYVVPTAPGYSAEIFASSRERYSFPNGEAWESLR